MAKQKTDDLIRLIHSLTKAEKRHFRLFVQRRQSSEEMLFLRLFDYLDKHEEYREAAVLKKLPDIKKSQLPNLKAHLYGQLLTSLRLLHKNSNDDILLREMIDYARVLYNKGLYRPSLNYLEKVKHRAQKLNYQAIALESIEFEKLIESQYVTQSIQGRAGELSSQSQVLNQVIEKANLFSSLSLQMYALFLKSGFARNAADYEKVQDFFEAHKPAVGFLELDFWGKIYYCQSHVWLYYIGQQFSACYRHVYTWVQLFEDDPSMKIHHPALYLKGLHNLLGTLFNTLDYNRFCAQLNRLEQFPQQVGGVMDNNVEGLFQLYRYLHRIDKHYLEGSYEDGLQLVPELARAIEQETYNWDDHRIMVLNYRIGCLYFAVGDNDNSIHYLNRIINQKNPDYRADIQCFARILSLIAHFELGNARLLEYQIKSVYRFLLQMEDLHQVQKEIFGFLRRTPSMRRDMLLGEFKRLHDKLLPLASDPFERRSFMYLDILSWLESKLQHRPLSAIVQEKFLERTQSVKQ